MLGMYVHTHWGYNRPYAARTWTLDDWQGYLAGLAQLGYDTIMLWPQFDAMPPQPNASDVAYLNTIRQVIDLAHSRYGMTFILTMAPNTIGSDAAGRYPFESRPYFHCERKVDPSDARQMDAFMEGRANQLALLPNLDGLAIIDSDPGGYVGSDNEHFVMLVDRLMQLARRHNPDATFYYWMLFGWASYCRFWKRMTEARQGETDLPHLGPRDMTTADFLETLPMIAERIAEPWQLLSGFPPHHEATRQLGMVDRRVCYPYGVIEGEPTFPLTNCEPDSIAAQLAAYSPGAFPRGIMANAQTHCLQLPHTYLFAHHAQQNVSPPNLEQFAQRLIPSLASDISRGWQAISHGAGEQRDAARQLRSHLGGRHHTGDCAGLLFGNADRFIEDLALNLDLRAALLDFGDQLTNASLQVVMDALVPYQARTGFVDAYCGPLDSLLHAPLRKLDAPTVHAVLDDFNNWRDPTIRHGLTPRLLRAIRDHLAA